MLSTTARLSLNCSSSANRFLRKSSGRAVAFERAFPSGNTRVILECDVDHGTFVLRGKRMFKDVGIDLK